MTYTWDVKTKRVASRGTMTQDGVTWTDDGLRYRYVCTCGHKGPWRINGNDADGDNHLYRAHSIGD